MNLVYLFVIIFKVADHFIIYCWNSENQHTTILKSSDQKTAIDTWKTYGKVFFTQYGERLRIVRRSLLLKGQMNTEGVVK
jgi:hypothetical protein